MHDGSAASMDRRMRPAVVCARLLEALRSAEGRRLSRKRDQMSDAIGILAKRSLLEAVVRDDPESGAFEAWLVDDVASLAPGWTNSAGGAMAQAVFEECQLAQRMTAFSQWLHDNAPSDDVEVRRVPSR